MIAAITGVASRAIELCIVLFLLLFVLYENCGRSSHEECHPFIALPNTIDWPNITQTEDTVGYELDTAA